MKDVNSVRVRMCSRARRPFQLVVLKAKFSISPLLPACPRHLVLSGIRIPTLQYSVVCVLPVIQKPTRIPNVLFSTQEPIPNTPTVTWVVQSVELISVPNVLQATKSMSPRERVLLYHHQLDVFRKALLLLTVPNVE